ncbi:leucine Rich Repeat domain-containing protein [Diaporthe helianthi]|uniref:Leucine Rich Repeat domain-containing protein n=1 Tax=Diaporthe helianthi TaxID=158607 RepID=A0A2P5HV79_DIAHE|nr:leucine Rich Repeat domain-containing protein [Diaporthe helianthi]
MAVPAAATTAPAKVNDRSTTTTTYKTSPPGSPKPSSPSSPSSPNLTNSRTSFSSIREDDTDLAQTFTSSKVSCYSLQQEQAVIDDESPGIMVSQAQFFAPLTQPGSRLHGNWVPADDFKGWKQINVRGRLASRSFGDLASLTLAWEPRPAPVKRTPSKICKVSGGSVLEILPLEILSAIINLLLLDVPPNGITKRNMDLMSLLLTSKKLHGATLLTLYRQITIPHSRIFSKFLAHVTQHPSLGTLVRRFDFCHFNPTTLFMTASERSQARNLTSDTLSQALELTPHLHEFLAQEHIDDELDASVLHKLFFGLERIQALDFCGCSCASFRDAFTATVCSAEWKEPIRLRRLSLHKCTTLPVAVFEKLLPNLPQLTHLDIAGTQVTDAALASLPSSACITHLNLAKCNKLSADAIINFISTHPAVTQSLVWLSLATDARVHETFDADAVTRLLPLLPATLRSLSLKGSSMNQSHVALLRPLTKHLEELALGRGLGVSDTNGLFVPDFDEQAGEGTDADGDSAMATVEDWEPHTLRYLDLSDMWSGDFDLQALYNTSGCALLTGQTSPLEVIEVPEDVARRLAKGHAPLTRLGWRVSELGSRTWVVRAQDEAQPHDNGGRGWKMGAENWGMRKIPVARAEVGGMYGSFMFARKL